MKGLNIPVLKGSSCLLIPHCPLQYEIPTEVNLSELKNAGTNQQSPLPLGKFHLEV